MLPYMISIKKKKNLKRSISQSLFIIILGHLMLGIERLLSTRTSIP